MSTSKITILTKFILDVMFYTGLLVCGTLPWTIKFFIKIFNAYVDYYLPMLIIFEAAGIMGLIIVNELRKILRTVISKNCFVRENVKSLKRMGACSFIIMLLMASRVFFILTYSTLVLVLVFFLAGMFSFVVAQVFEAAIEYKEENDLTI